MGKEKLQSGKPDSLKGSFYANPIHDSAQSTIEMRERFPEYTSPNTWPSEQILPGFESIFKELGRVIVDTGALVARACDKYASQNMKDYPSCYLENIILKSTTTKARLLHYFPPQDLDLKGGSIADDYCDSWCGEHLDHSALTGLTSAIFINEKGTYEPILSPDQKAGLYVRSRSGKTFQVQIPSHCVAFQTGEALELASGGQFRAVPHYVYGGDPSKMKGVARNTLAVFMQPALDDILPGVNSTFADFAAGILDKGIV